MIRLESLRSTKATQYKIPVDGARAIMRISITHFQYRADDIKGAPNGPTGTRLRWKVPVERLDLIRLPRFELNPYLIDQCVSNTIGQLGSLNSLNRIIRMSNNPLVAISNLQG